MDHYGTIVAEGRDGPVEWQDIRVDNNESTFSLADKATRIWRAVGRLRCVNAEVGDRVVIQFVTYPRIKWGVWKAKAIARPPAANRDRKELA